MGVVPLVDFAPFLAGTGADKARIARGVGCARAAPIRESAGS